MELEGDRRVGLAASQGTVGACSPCLGYHQHDTSHIGPNIWMEFATIGEPYLVEGTIPGYPPPFRAQSDDLFFLWNTSICFQTCRLTCHTINSSQFLPTRDFHFMCFFRPHMLLLKVVFKRQASCLLHATQLGRSSFYSC